MRPRILSVLVALLLGIVEAFGSHQVIVRLENKKENKERKEIKEIVKFMGGRVLDQIPEKDLYLVELPDPEHPAAGWGSLSHKIGLLSSCPVLLVK